MSWKTHPTIPPEEYLARETEAEYKSEYRAGEIVAMTGASRPHVLIATNLVRELGLQLKHRPCEVYAMDMRLKVQAAGLYTYPDVMVVCGKPQFADGRNDTLSNPVFIIEILSRSTETYDRGQKFEWYKKLPSLQEYVLVHQDRIHVQRFAKQGITWTEHVTTDRENEVRLSAIDCVLALREVYDKVDVQ